MFGFGKKKLPADVEKRRLEKQIEEQRKISAMRDKAKREKDEMARKRKELAELKMKNSPGAQAVGKVGSVVGKVGKKVGGAVYTYMTTPPEGSRSYTMTTPKPTRVPRARKKPTKAKKRSPAKKAAPKMQNSANDEWLKKTESFFGGRDTRNQMSKKQKSFWEM